MIYICVSSDPTSHEASYYFNQTVRTPSRSGDGALLNSDMRGSESFDYKMFHLLSQVRFFVSEVDGSNFDDARRGVIEPCSRGTPQMDGLDRKGTAVRV